MTNLISISNARAILPDLVEKVNEKLERVVITVSGKPKVVMVSMEELESLEETAEIFAENPNIIKDLKKSEKQIKQDKFTLLKDLK